MLGTSEDIRSPVEGMVTVVDCAAGFRRFMNGAEILPFAGAHFGTRLSRAWGVVVHERD